MSGRKSRRNALFRVGPETHGLQGLGGGRTRARTWDPLIKSQLLYQLSYAPGTGPESLRERASFSKATPRCPANRRDIPPLSARLAKTKKPPESSGLSDVSIEGLRR